MTEFNNNWFQFLLRQGAQIAESAPAEVGSFTNAPSNSSASFVSPLTDFGLIAVSGDDAAHFLHNQLTNDVEHLGPGEARLAGYCSSKGRLLATLLVWKSEGVVMLQLPREILPATQRRLQMFVLRAKAKLTDVSDQHVVLGLVGPDIPQALAPWFAALPDTPYHKIDAASGTLIRVPDANGKPRYQWVTTIDIACKAWPELAKTLRPAGTAAWRLTDIEAGIPRVTQSTQEQFVPQMINFEVVGGVNFRKGCYPGQEVVARSQYLGKLKRRMLPASLTAEQVQAGMEVFSSRDPEQPCGMIVNAEASAPSQFHCLVEIKTGVLDSGTIHLGSASGPVLEFGTLPYSLPDNG